MKSFKNYFPLFCIAFLLVAVKGDRIGIEITPHSNDYDYSVTAKCWDNDKYVGSCKSHGPTCWIPLYKTKGIRENGEYRVTRKRIECSGNQYRIYVQRINAGGRSDGVSRDSRGF
jgi:hypothetical protein